VLVKKKLSQPAVVPNGMKRASTYITHEKFGNFHMQVMGLVMQLKFSNTWGSQRKKLENNSMHTAFKFNY
jgi:hypothetical protein